MARERSPFGDRSCFRRRSHLSAGTLFSVHVSNRARRMNGRTPTAPTVPRRHSAALLAALAFFSFALPRAAVAQQLDVIRGQVTGPEAQAIENATVTATSVAGGVNRSARTDRNGRFTITFPGGEGD